jgi:F-box domain
MSLVTLPVEIIYRILDHIDTGSILISFRYVCKQFHMISDTYNRYRLDVCSTLSVDIKRLAHLIQPENVISLTVQDNWCTKYNLHFFFQLFDKDRFVQLRELTLNGITARNLDCIFDVFPSCPRLVSLSINANKSWNEEKGNLLLSQMSQFQFRKLNLKNFDSLLKNIFWKHLSTIQDITLETCTLSQYETILNSLTDLKKLTMRDCLINDRNNVIVTTYPQLISLSINDCHLSIDDIQLVISLTPSLVNLKLFSRREIFDSTLNGSFWKQFIQTNLSSLDKFQFFFSYTMRDDDITIDVDSLIHSFQTPFFSSNKIGCDYYIQRRMINIYTLPINNLSQSIEISSKPSIAIRWTISPTGLNPTLNWMDGMFDVTSTEVFEYEYFHCLLFKCRQKL